MKTNDIRKTFLDFFAARGHLIVPSASLVPANDPTLLFTSAGMVPFKDAFLGRGAPPAPRVADVQRCLRAGGKHNDLENVGYTARHHTFFEMLGNWSFGDYFKRDAIACAWELLTEVWKLPSERLWVTVYHTDDEAYDIWAREIGVPADRIARIADNQGAPYASDNFWQMADTGPCGPCTEVFYDHGPALAGAPPGSGEPEGDRYVEIWNLVFMQYDQTLKEQHIFEFEAEALTAFKSAVASGAIVARPEARPENDGTQRFVVNHYNRTTLPRPCVDTGMGLERIAAVLQRVNSNYDIDLFRHLIRAAADAVRTQDLQSNSLKVIADHIRATAFLIADGVLPSNEGRGYVLRRIMRRAIRHGYQLGQKQPFFYKLVTPLIEEMGEAYPYLVPDIADIARVILDEEKRFAVTVENGMSLLASALSEATPIVRLVANSIPDVREIGQNIIESWSTGSNRLTGALLTSAGRIAIQTDFIEQASLAKLTAYTSAILSRGFHDYVRLVYVVVGDASARTIFDNKFSAPQIAEDVTVEVRFVTHQDLKPFKFVAGDVAFKLYDTYGFPLDLTMDAAREQGFTVDVTGFEREMEKQRERSRAASKFVEDYSRGMRPEGKTEFSGHGRLADAGPITALFLGDEAVQSLSMGQEGAAVLDRTPFYAEAGGQVGDAGVLVGVRARSGARFIVTDTQKRGDAYAHIGRVEAGAIHVGDIVRAEVDAERRQAIVLNHSATHLLHAALRKLLGEHVIQKGSLVAPNRLRFDFSHPRPVAADERVEIENLVNTEIRRNVAAEVREMPYDEAIGSGAMALFGEKYGDKVRVMRFGDFSTELCGGTHVARTGDIGLFKIVAESGIAAGIRRIEAVTGAGALGFVREEERRLDEIAELVKAGRDETVTRVNQLVARVRSQEKELADLRRRLASGSGSDLAAQAVEIGGHKLLAARLDGADAQTLRAAVDRLKDKLGSAAIVLGAVEGDKVRLAAGVTRDLAPHLPASELINVVAERVGGRGGGRADFAQAGGTEPDKLDEALAHVTDWFGERLASG